jgi:hypothetical protein
VNEEELHEWTGRHETNNVVFGVLVCRTAFEVIPGCRRHPQVGVWVHHQPIKLSTNQLITSTTANADVYVETKQIYPTASNARH